MAVLTNKVHPNHKDRLPPPTPAVDQVPQDSTPTSIAIDTSTSSTTMLTGATALAAPSTTTDWQEAFGAIHRMIPGLEVNNEKKRSPAEELIAMMSASMNAHNEQQRPTNANNQVREDGVVVSAVLYQPD